jgi:hypothetical protein
MAGKSNATGTVNGLLHDIHQAFLKHKLSGGSMMIKPAAAADSVACPEGQAPHEIQYQEPNGSVVTKVVCY